MALTKIGATLGGSADVIQVTQSSHGLSLGYPVKVSGNGTYAHATADSAANAEAIGIIIATTTDTMTIALGGRITVDGVLPSGNLAAGTVLFLPTSAGKLTATEPSGNNEVSKPMAVITYLNSEMIMIQQRGEVISTAGITLADESVDSDHYVDGSIDLAHMSVNSIDSDQYVDGSIDSAHIANDQIDSQHYAAGSIDLEHMSSESVDEDNLHISNAGSNGQFLSKQSGNAGGLTWAAATPTFIGVKAVHGADQDTTSGSEAAVTFTATDEWDTDTMHSTSSNPSRITFNTAGKYFIQGHVQIVGNTSGRRHLAIRLNGGNRNVVTQSSPSLADQWGHQVSVTLDVSANDYVELMFLQTSGSTLAIQYNNGSPWFTAHKID